MLKRSAGCIGRWNDLGETAWLAIAHFHATHRFWESGSKSGMSKVNWIALPADPSRMPGIKPTRFPLRTLLHQVL
jgi:hypothetical protein